MPDLVAEIDYYPKNASVGDNITVIAIVKNIGDVDATNVMISIIKPTTVNALYSPTNISANSEKILTFNWTLRYGKDIIRLRVDYNNQINETNESNNNATLIFDFSIIVKTNKEKYALGELVNISIIGNNGSGSIFVRYQSFPFKVFKFENGSWIEKIADSDSFSWYGGAFSPPYCKNGTIKRDCCFDRIPKTCRSVNVSSSWTWDQKYWNYSNLTCGNETYSKWMYIPVEPGMYKIRLYYSGYSCNAFSCSDLYVESNNFTILQNCSSDSDCAYGERCINETCLPVQNYCENNSQCDDNQVCVNHTCSNLLPDLVAEIDYYPKNASVGDTVTVINTVKNVRDTNVTNVFIRNIMPTPVPYPPWPPTNISANSEKILTFNWTLRYGKDMIMLVVDEYNQINETNETNNNATLIFNFPVIVKTNKEKYALEEPVNTGIIGNGSGHIYVRYSSFPFKVFKFENGSWIEKIADSDFFHWYGAGFPPYCENGTVKQTVCCAERIPKACKSVNVNSFWIWDQRYWNYSNLTCGNETYNKWMYIPVEPGLYKIGLYYNSYIGFSAFSCDYYLYVESNNFTILQNCSSDLDCAYGEKCINETCLPVQNYCENNSQCNDNQVCVNHTCSNLLPDLVAEIDYYPKNASVGDTVTVVQTIRNLGEVNLTDVKIVYTGSYFEYILPHAGFNISANSEINFTFNFTVKYGINYSKFKVITIADILNTINETNESNNNATLIFDFHISLPDLVAEINYYPSNASPGDTVTVVQTIRNLGEDNLTNVGIRYTTAKGIIESAKIYPPKYPPSGINLSANSEINYTFNFTIRYGRFIVKVAVDIRNEIDETNESNNNATLIFDFPVSVRTDKEIYSLGEMINISIIGNGSGSIGAICSGSGCWEFPFKVFKFENGTWNEIEVMHPIQSTKYHCENGTLHFTLGDPILVHCRIIPVNSLWTWDQTQQKRITLTCGNRTYTQWNKFQVNLGTYKVVLEYIGYYTPLSSYPYFCTKGTGISIESNNFTILQNCSSDSDCTYGERCINETCLPVQNYCENNSQCNDNEVCVNHTCQNISCNYWQIAKNHSCILKSGYCENSNDCQPEYYCSNHRCYKKSTGGGGYTGVIDVSGGVLGKATYPKPKEFNASVSNSIPSEFFGNTTTLNLGKEGSYATVIVTIGNKTSTSKADANGDVTITFSGYGEGNITISTSGFENLTKTITVYAGALNITKISGEKYGDEFKFKVIDNNGNPVEGATVEVYGNTLKTDAKGIVRTTIKTIQSSLEASASLKDYKGSSISFNVKAIGKLKINVPENVTKGDIITITVTDENNNPVQNAKVTINGVEKTTDENGKVEYKVTTNLLTLKASKEGYIPSKQESVSVKEKVECGNGKCEAGETKENCPSDCIKCGDNVCDKGESYENCPSDCPKPSDNTLLIAVIILIVIVLIALYFLMRKKKKK